MEAFLPFIAVFAVIFLSAKLSSRNSRGRAAARPQPVRPTPVRPTPAGPVPSRPFYEAKPAADPFANALRQQSISDRFTEGTDPCHDDMSGFTEGTDPCHDDMSSFTEGTDPCHDDMSSFTEGTDPCHDGLYPQRPIRKEEAPASSVLPSYRSQQLLQGVVFSEILQRRPIRAYRPTGK